MSIKNKSPLIGIVGVCASGKSTLVKALSANGYRCRHIAQEHSYVKDMWQRLTKPDILIFLEVSYPKTLQRKNLNWTLEEYLIQCARLEHAYEHADLRILTDFLTPQELYEAAVQGIEQLTGFHPSSNSFSETV
ncbi:MAG: hypothetical protein ABFC97_08665 [Anaerolineaceae bacterium]